MNLKGLILAAGRGTRLKPLTDRRSKPMVLLGNRPLLDYSLEKLSEAGIREIGIVAGENEDELRAVSYHGAELTVIRQPEPKGLAHAVSYARDFTGDDDFVLLFCDNLFSQPLRGSVAEWERLRREPDSDVQCLIHVNEVPDPRTCGVAVVEDGWVRELEEKPQAPKSNLAIAGIDFFTPLVYEAIGRIEPSFRGELEITDAIAELLTLGHRVRAERLGGFWFDTGTISDLLTAQEFVLNHRTLSVSGERIATVLIGHVGIGPHTQIMHSTIHGPAIIGEHCDVVGSRLGPNVAIGDACIIDGCELSQCIVYPGVALSGVTAFGEIFDGDTCVAVEL